MNDAGGRPAAGDGDARPASGVPWRRWWDGLRWWTNGVVGQSAYTTYVEHLRRRHPEAPIPDERQFWRDKYEQMDRNPGARCC
ncbi:YbdD/YjiX family protein [Nakamurella flava]|uniref:YbdD/YjiX family protein n=1 Tax=Nakamurella flava TaxID=2576308 RepID=A0A4V6CSQ8_9ACTN|nr:YbdD/YjiX family protein [Nakamurella flava]TKV55965.1 YbdD/YjiX family protein [Nakamurella flava]